MIRLIASQGLRQLYSTPLAWTATALVLALFSWLLFLQLEVFVRLLPQLIEKGSTLGLWTLVSAPSLALGALILMLLTPLVGMNSISDELSSGRMSLYLSSPLSPWQFVLGKWLALVVSLLPAWTLILLAALSIQAGGHIDWLLALSAASGLLALLCLAAAITIWLSALTNQGLLAGALASALLFLLWLLEGRGDGLQLLSLSNHLNAFLRGQPGILDLGYFLALTGWGLGLAWLRIWTLCGRNQGGLWASKLFSLLLSLALILGLALLKQYNLKWDVTRHHGNSLATATQELLGKLHGPVQLTAFVPDLPVQRGIASQVVDRFIAAYPETKVQYIDPTRTPERTKQLGISDHGQMLIEYGGRSERIDRISEQGIANALARLALDNRKWIITLAGHGEASLNGKANFDLGEFARLLKKKGYKALDFDLSATGQLPSNTGLVIVAAPRSPLNLTELGTLQNYLNQGGNLLWLAEQDLPKQISEQFGIALLPGTLVDAAAASLGLDSPTVAVAGGSLPHVVTSSLDAPVLLPEAHALEISEAEQGWQVEPLLQTGQRSWNETGSLTGEISRDPSLGEVQGPLTLGFTLERSIGDGRQRLAFIGDVDFLSNAWLGNAANPDFALALIHWLSANDQLISLGVHSAPDLAYDQNPATAATLAFLFLFGLPGAILIVGWFRYRLRRRA